MALSDALLLGQCQELERERDRLRERVEELEEEVAVLKTRCVKKGRPSQRPPREELFRRYWEEREPVTEMAARYRVSETTVKRWLREEEIPRRSHSLADGGSLGDRGRRLRTSVPSHQREAEA